MKLVSSGKRPSGRSQLRTAAARAINLLLLLGFCILAGTGLMLVFRLPPGSRGGRGLEVLGFDRHRWGDVHFWISIAVCVLLVVHLLLHLAWLKKVAGHGRWRMIVLGLGVGIAVLALPLLLPVTGRSAAEIRPGVAAGNQAIPVSNDPPVSFKRDVLPVFEMSCIDCHGPKKKQKPTFGSMIWRRFSGRRIRAAWFFPGALRRAD